MPTCALLIYVVAMTAYVYGFEHRPDADYARETGPDEALVFGGVALLHVALGFVVGPLAIVVPLLPVLIAIPAGEYPGRWPESPVWSAMLYSGLFFGVPLVAVGIVLKSMAHRRKRRSVLPGQPE